MSEDEIYAEFQERGIAFEKLEHLAVHTVEESAAIHASLPARHTKTLFLKDKQGRFWLVTLRHDKRANLKAFAALLGAGKLSFGKPEDMLRLQGVTPGSVTPIAAANAGAGEVNVVFDADFATARGIAVHPLRNTPTIALHFDALAAWLADHGIVANVVDLP